MSNFYINVDRWADGLMVRWTDRWTEKRTPISHLLQAGGTIVMIWNICFLEKYIYKGKYKGMNGIPREISMIWNIFFLEKVHLYRKILRNK